MASRIWASTKWPTRVLTIMGIETTRSISLMRDESGMQEMPRWDGFETMRQHAPACLAILVWFFFFLSLFSFLSLLLCINFVHQLCSTALLLNCFLYFYFFYVIKVRVLKISMTLSLENQNLTEIDWNRNTTETDGFQPFRSVSVENFTNRNIRFQLAIHIQNRPNRAKHTLNKINES